MICNNLYNDVYYIYDNNTGVLHFIEGPYAIKYNGLFIFQLEFQCNLNAELYFLPSNIYK